MSKVTRIDESELWAEYAELNTPPLPKYAPQPWKVDPLSVGIVILGCCTFWAVAWVVGEILL